MSQSEAIVAALAAAFVVWLAAAGKLGVYWSLLTGGGASGSGGGSASAGSGSTAAKPPTSYLIPPIPSLNFPGVIDPFPHAPGFE